MGDRKMLLLSMLSMFSMNDFVKELSSRVGNECPGNKTTPPPLLQSLKHGPTTTLDMGMSDKEGQGLCSFT